MPIYEFGCNACGEQYEKLVFSTTATAPCPKCESDDVRRLLSRFASRSSGKFTPSAGGSSCDGCTSTNCSSCH